MATKESRTRPAVKVDVVYDKPAIMRLIERDLKARDIPIPKGARLEYRGALRVTLTLFSDEAAPGPEGAATTMGSAEPPGPEPLAPSPSALASKEDSADFAEVLAASQRLELDGQPRFGLAKKPQRTLAPNEFCDVQNE
jgi:hypothetical protein